MKEFDKIIKDKLSDIDSPYAGDTWANIQKALPQKKKRPYGLFFMSFVLIMILSLPVISYFNKKASETLPKSTQPISTGEQMAYNGVNNQNTTESQASTSAQLSTQAQNLGSSHQLNTDQNTNTTKNTSTRTLISNDLTSQASEKSNNQSNAALNASIVSETFATMATNSTVAIESSNIANTLTENQNVDDVSLRENFVQMAKITLPSTGRVFGTDQSHLFESVQMSMKKNASLPCPTFVRKQNLSFIEFYFANDYGIRNMSLKSSDKNAYLDKRNNTEFPFFSYSAGTRFGIGWESGIAFKSGLDYTQINEKFIYTDPNSIQRKTITLIKYIYDSNFNVVDSTKTVEEVEIPGSNKVVNYNKYRFVDIPVLFQYTIPGKKRLSYSITAGPYINISFSQSGKILSEDNKNLLDISDKKLYKDNIGLSLYTALAINYQLTKTTQIVFEPNIRYIPNSISQLQNPIDQKYLIASIAAGFRYKI